MPEFLDPFYPEMLHHSENLSIKYHEQKFLSTLLFQGSIEQGYQSNNVKNSVLGCLIKTSISALNFSTESAKERTINDLLFLIAIYSPKNDNRHPSKMRN